MAAFQRVLDLGPASHFDVLHGGHRNRVSLVTLEPAMAKPWREKSYSHDTARALVAELADEYLDLYLSQNSFKAWRNTRNVAALTSCYVDLDTYNIPALAGLDAEEILSRAMLAFPWMPVPTMLASSGRGVYFIWVFDKPLSPDALPRWQTVEGALVGLLKGLGADAKAKDATRVLRVAGSLHAKTGERVHYEHIADTVKFSELERLVREQLIPEPPVRRERPAESQPKAKRKTGSVKSLWNGYTLAYWRMKDLEALARMRGPLKDYRARFLYAYSVSAAWYCQTPEDLVSELDSFAQEFFVDSHRYQGETQCKTILERVAMSKRGLKMSWQGKEVDPRYRMHNRTLIELLDITPAEQTHLKVILSTIEKDRRYRLKHPLTRGEYLQDAALVRREKREEAEELLRQGYTATSAARALGITRMTLHRRLNAV